ncbi:uncharacterized protein DS421_15g509520 [Arachis hypogaea]|nr:uncharacterized protein DS421_15g509520 [Arachis hypogaea]
MMVSQAAASEKGFMPPEFLCRRRNFCWSLSPEKTSCCAIPSHSDIDSPVHNASVEIVAAISGIPKRRGEEAFNLVAVAATGTASVLGFSQYPLVHYRSHMLRVRVVFAAAKVNKAVMQAADNFGLIETSGDAFGLWFAF